MVDRSLIRKPRLGLPDRPVVQATGQRLIFATDAQTVAKTAPGRIVSPKNLAALNLWTTITKTVDETIISDNTLSDDAVLKFAMLANTKYMIRARMIYVSGTTPDFSFDIAGPAAPTLVAMGLLMQDAAGVNTLTASILTGFSAGATDADGQGLTFPRFLWFEGVVHNGANAGNFSIQWAQKTLDASNTTVYAGSYLEYRIVA